MRAREVVGEAQRGVDPAVERAVDVGEEPVDRLRPRTARGSPSCSAFTARASASVTRNMSASIVGLVARRSTAGTRGARDRAAPTSARRTCGSKRERSAGVAARERQVRREVRVAAEHPALVAPVAGEEVVGRDVGARGSPTRGAARRRTACTTLRLPASTASRPSTTSLPHSTNRSSKPPSSSNSVAADGDARAGDREHVAVPRRSDRAATASRGACPRRGGRRTRCRPRIDAAVLDLAVGADELRADEADAGLHRPADQLAQPAADRASRCRRSGRRAPRRVRRAPRVVHRRVVERLRSHHSTRRSRSGNVVGVPLLVVVGALAVVDDDDVEASGSRCREACGGSRSSIGRLWRVGMTTVTCGSTRRGSHVSRTVPRSKVTVAGSPARSRWSSTTADARARRSGSGRRRRCVSTRGTRPTRVVVEIAPQEQVPPARRRRARSRRPPTASEAAVRASRTSGRGSSRRGASPATTTAGTADRCGARARRGGRRPSRRGRRAGPGVRGARSRRSSRGRACRRPRSTITKSRPGACSSTAFTSASHRGGTWCATNAIVVRARRDRTGASGPPRDRPVGPGLVLDRAQRALQAVDPAALHDDAVDPDRAGHVRPTPRAAWRASWRRRRGSGASWSTTALCGGRTPRAPELVAEELDVLTRRVRAGVDPEPSRPCAGCCLRA